MWGITGVRVDKALGHSVEGFGGLLRVEASGFRLCLLCCIISRTI